MSSTYWCYRCNRFVRVSSQNPISCPDCNAGFVEEIDGQSSSLSRYPAAAMYMTDIAPAAASASGSGSSPRPRRNRRVIGSERSPFNPVIVLRGPNDAGGGGGGGGGDGSGFELFHDDGSGSGLRPLPTSMSEFLLGSGFERLLNQLAQIEANGTGRIDRNPPASKAAVESMPTVEINDKHVTVDSYCAVCKEAFDLGCEAREMPCKHLYHQDCILPWLSLRNSCPVCRHELPADATGGGGRDGIDASRGANAVGNDDEAVGLTIWRLPGGGFAVGRFSGGGSRGRGGRELPVVYTEMDGAFNNNGVPRRTPLGSRGNVSRERGGLRRAFHNLFACFGRGQSSTSSSSLDSRMSRRSSPLTSVFSSSSRRRRGWGFEVDDGNNRRCHHRNYVKRRNKIFPESKRSRDGSYGIRRCLKELVGWWMDV